MNEKLVIDFDEYIGAVKLNSEWRFFREVMSMWILDYKSYDPEYDPLNSNSNGWRENLLAVDTQNAKEYCHAMKNKEIMLSQIPLTFTEFGSQAKLTFVVNFDEKIFVSSLYDMLAVQRYVPRGWKGLEDDSYQYIPAEFRSLWDS